MGRASSMECHKVCFSETQHGVSSAHVFLGHRSSISTSQRSSFPTTNYLSPPSDRHTRLKTYPYRHPLDVGKQTASSPQSRFFSDRSSSETPRERKRATKVESGERRKGKKRTNVSIQQCRYCILNCHVSALTAAQLT